MDDPIGEELAGLEAEFDGYRRNDAEAEARDRLHEAERAETFRDFLLALPPGMTLGLVTSEGAEVWGVVEAVGADKLRLSETGRSPVGASGRRRVRRVHDVRLEAVVRVIREGDEWA